ncbi:hypothetical protein CHS0354_014258, partial [Potamilus streckersoni]
MHTQSVKGRGLQYATEENMSTVKANMKSTDIYSVRTTSPTLQNVLDIRQNHDNFEKNDNEGNKGNVKLAIADRAKTIRVSKMLFVVMAFFVL